MRREAGFGDRALSDNFIRESFQQFHDTVKITNLHTSPPQASTPSESTCSLPVIDSHHSQSSLTTTASQPTIDVEKKQESHDLFEATSGLSNGSVQEEAMLKTHHSHEALSTITSYSSDLNLDNMTTSLPSLTATPSVESVAELRRRAWYEMFPENLINVTMLYDRDDCVTFLESGEPFILYYPRDTSCRYT